MAGKAFRATVIPLLDDKVQEAYELLKTLWSRPIDEQNELFAKIAAKKIELKIICEEDAAAELQVRIWPMDDARRVRDELIASSDAFWSPFLIQLNEVIPTPLNLVPCILL